MEAKLQSKIIEWLKANGVYVIKTRVLPGVPVGCPDIIGLYGDRFLVIEVKAKPNASFRAGQQETLRLLRDGAKSAHCGNKFVYVACPENWPVIKQEITAQFF
jgi:Holliday junction resolvase